MAKRRRSGRRTDLHRTPGSDDGVCEWAAYGGTRMFVVGYTSGGAPYGWIEGEDGSWLDEDDSPRSEAHLAVGLEKSRPGPGHVDDVVVPGAISRES